MILDSNIMVAYLYPEDALHTAARQFIDTLQKPLEMFEYHVAETATVLSRRSGKATADRFLDLVADNADIKILPSSFELFQAIVACYRAHNQRALSFADYTLLYLSQSTPIATFDTKLRNAIKRDKGKYYEGTV